MMRQWEVFLRVISLNLEHPLVRPEHAGVRFLPIETAIRIYRGYFRVFLVEEHLSGRHLKVVNEDFHRYLPDTRCSYCVADD